MTRLAHGLTISLASLMFAILVLLVRPGAGQQAAAEARCNLVAAYGTIFVAPGNHELDITPDNRAGLIEEVRLCVETVLAPEKLAVYREASAFLDGQTGAGQDQIERDLLRIEIASLLDENATVRQQRAVAHRLAGGSKMLALAVQRGAAGTALQSLGWSSAYATETPRHNPADYVKACEVANVPVPRSIKTDQGWSKEKVLDFETNRYLLRFENQGASVWTYRHANGGYCISLSRKILNLPNMAPLIGTICVNAKETHACFFDNLVAGNTAGNGKRRLDLAEFISTDFSALLHPMDGDDTCSACHLGANPFLVDPTTELGKTIIGQYGPKKGGVKFAFAGMQGIKGGWFNFDLIEEQISGTGCQKCHEFPMVTKNSEYCTSILLAAVNHTMPPGYWPTKPEIDRKFFWPDNGCFHSSQVDLAEYFDSMRQFKAICSGTKIKECKNATGLADVEKP